MNIPSFGFFLTLAAPPEPSLPAPPAPTLPAPPAPTQVSGGAGKKVVEVMGWKSNHAASGASDAGEPEGEPRIERQPTAEMPTASAAAAADAAAAVGVIGATEGGAYGYAGGETAELCRAAVDVGPKDAAEPLWPDLPTVSDDLAKSRAISPTARPEPPPTAAAPPRRQRRG